MLTETFTYHGVELPYLRHMYNLTFFNERAVEVPIAHWWLAQRPHLEEVGVEVGNVLSHYSRRNHLVMDLNEPPAWYQELSGQPYLNADILEVRENTRTPWIVSLSTIEHTENPLYALSVMKAMVVDGGRLLCTFPTGVRPELDEWLMDGAPSMTRACTIARIND